MSLTAKIGEDGEITFGTLGDMLSVVNSPLYIYGNDLKGNDTQLPSVKQMVQQTTSEALHVASWVKTGNATIVTFKDGVKTVVKLRKGDTASPEAALAYAIAKRVYGSNSAFEKSVIATDMAANLLKKQAAAQAAAAAAAAKIKKAKERKLKRDIQRRAYEMLVEEKAKACLEQKKVKK